MASTVVEHWVGTSWPNRKYVADTHRALIPTCRHSLKVCSGWRHSSCKKKTRLSQSLGLFRCLACTANADCTIHVCSAGNLITIIDKLWGDIRHFVPGWPNGPVALTPMSATFLLPLHLTRAIHTAVRTTLWAVQSWAFTTQHLTRHKQKSTISALCSLPASKA